MPGAALVSWAAFAATNLAASHAAERPEARRASPHVTLQTPQIATRRLQSPGSPRYSGAIVIRYCSISSRCPASSLDRADISPTLAGHAATRCDAGNGG